MYIDKQKLTSASDLRQLIIENNLYFFDFGCSNGSGTRWTQKALSKNGLGFDIDIRKLNQADAEGVLCTNLDILDIPNERIVSMVQMFHMLEHLESTSMAAKFIEKACTVASDCVVIKQPYSDADPQLFSDGFKTYYSHWTGHKNQMTTPDFYYLLDYYKSKALLKDFVIGYKKPIKTSDDPYIHSIASPKDSLHYEAGVHPPKQVGFEFTYPVYFEIQIAIDINGGGYGEIWKKLAPDFIRYDSKIAHSTTTG